MGINENYLILIGWAIILNAGGWIYALQISHTPSSPGHTHESVGTGTWMIAVGEALGVTLIFYLNMVTLINMMGIIFITPALLGGPMWLLQTLKKKNTDKAINTIKEEHDFSKKL